MVDSDPHEELIKSKEDSAKIQRVGMLIDGIFKNWMSFTGLWAYVWIRWWEMKYESPVLPDIRMTHEKTIPKETYSD